MKTLTYVPYYEATSNQQSEAGKPNKTTRETKNYASLGNLGNPRKQTPLEDPERIEKPRKPEKASRAEQPSRRLKFYLSLYGHRLPVMTLDVSDDSQIIASGSADKNVRLGWWGLEGQNRKTTLENNPVSWFCFFGDLFFLAF